MSKGKTIERAEPVVLVGKNNGITVIPSPTPLTRLHYFDGKFLRARDLELEQNYLRQLVALSNQAGGSGVVHGLSCDLAGNSLGLGPGLAIDGQGRVLLLPESRDFDLAALIEASRRRYADSLPKPIPFPGGFSLCCDALADEPGTVSEGATFYLISICHAEALCGEEDVFGKLCAAACTVTTERPYTLEGLVLRALPLDFSSLLPSSTASPVPITGKHLRSRVAAAYFEDERQKVASLISEGGLKSSVWCHGAAPEGATCVPLALIGRAGSQTLFLDSWTVRRERIETPPRRYWAGILAMRPWDVYLAQVLQFQCQLACCLNGHTASEADPECVRAYELLRQTAEQLALMIGAAKPANLATAGTGVDSKQLDYKQLESLRGRLVDAGAGPTALPRENRLLSCGFVELPSAGYLPVDLSAQATVNEQVRAMMGDSVDLRFCVVRPDFVPHAFEEAQHMERISLLYGYDHRADKPKVDILVPNGQIEEDLGKISGEGYVFDLTLTRNLIDGFAELAAGARGNPLQNEGSLSLLARSLAGQEEKAVPKARGKAKKAASEVAGKALGRELSEDLMFYGAARSEVKAGGALAFYYAGRTQLASPIGPYQQQVTQQQGTLQLLRRQRALVINSNSGGNTAGQVITELTPKAEIWLESKLGADPFDLQTNETTSFDVEVVLLDELGEERQALRLHLVGELAVAARSQGATGIRLGLRFTASLAVEHHSDIDDRSNVVPIHESLIIDRKAGSGFGAAHELLIQALNLFPGRLTLEVKRSFPAAGMAKLSGIASRKGTTETLQVFAGEQTLSAEALRAGNPAHDASISALGLLGIGLEDASFADSRARRLFPPPKGAQQDLVVRARLPWVLFHRRRDKVCASGALENVVPARRFRLFHIGLESRDQVEVLFELLQKGSGLDNYNPQFVATVEFAAGLASVQNAFGPLQDSWDQASADGDSLIFGAIAGQGQVLNEGETLAQARLGALAGVLAPITPSAMPDFELLDAIHPDLPANGLDGSIVYATLASAALECQTVFVVPQPLPNSELDRLTQQVVSNSFSTAGFDSLGGGELQKLLFGAGTASADLSSLADLIQALEAKFPDFPLVGYSILTVSREGSTTTEQALHNSRSQTLLDKLQGIRLTQSVVNGPKTPLPFECPAVSVLVVVVG